MAAPGGRGERRPGSNGADSYSYHPAPRSGAVVLLTARAIFAVLVWTTVLSSALAAAQRTPTVGIEVSVARVRTHGGPGGTAADARGLVIGGEGSIGWRQLVLRVGYRQGQLTEIVADRRRDHVEGFAVVGIRPIQNLEIAVGPHARAVITETGTRRWVLWHIRARYVATIVPSLLDGHADLWGGLAGNVAAGSFDLGRGGEVGIALRPGGGPFGLRLGYAVQSTRLDLGARRETLEGLTVTFRVGRD